MRFGRFNESIDSIAYKGFDTEEVVGSNPIVPTIFRLESIVCRRDRLIPITIRVLSKRHLKAVKPRYDISGNEISSVHVFLGGHLR